MLSSPTRASSDLLSPCTLCCHLAGKVLGGTDPIEAADKSLRRHIYENWEALGLPAQPDVGDNGVHASASPFEAMAERHNWVKAASDSNTNSNTNTTE